MGDPEEWLRRFDNYCAYRALDEPKALALFKMLMAGGASVWMESMPDGVMILTEQIAFKQSVLVYKCLHGSTPVYLTDDL